MMTIVSCEHAANLVPPQYQALFNGDPGVLRSHEGWDVGAVTVARAIADRLASALHVGTITRLLVDLNRSAGSEEVFSRFSKDLPEHERQALFDLYYRPYRAAVESDVRAGLVQGAEVAHFSIHSFDPSLSPLRNHTDVGLLFDPDRVQEVALVRRLEAALIAHCPRVRIRDNFPYEGRADGLTTHLRGAFPDPQPYMGIEIELNQELFGEENPDREVTDAVVDAVCDLTTSRPYRNQDR